MQVDTGEMHWQSGNMLKHGNLHLGPTDDEQIFKVD